VILNSVYNIYLYKLIIFLLKKVLFLLYLII